MIKPAGLVAFLLLMFVNFSASAQEKYWVVFKDKPQQQPFDPYSFFDAKAIERRLAQGLPLYDETDLPVNPEYLRQVKNLADSFCQASRWFNMAAVVATPHQLENLAKLSFVREIIPIQTQAAIMQTAEELDTGTNVFRLIRHQVNRMQGNEFWDRNINGTGIRIAVFDAGFTNVNTHPAFEHLRKEGRILKTWDFIKNSENVYHGHTHGLSVLSCIAGYYKGQHIGLATGAEFLLARTEWARTEKFREEENWLAAAEWADQNGAHIINSSLGYTYHRYFNNQMDGRSFVSRAANYAARKGMLVVNAAGNEGADRWFYIGAPADADSVLSIGGIDPYKDMRVEFSSYGPTSDMRLKPNVAAMGIVGAAAKNGGLKKTQGTSFSSPLVAGFAACAWSIDPGRPNMELFRLIEQSGHLYPYYDYAHGYGIPQAGFFTSVLAANQLRKKEIQPTFIFEEDESGLAIKVADHMRKGLRVTEYGPDDLVEEIFSEEITEETEEEKSYKLLFYHIAHADGRLKKYAVILVEHVEVITFDKDDFNEGEILRVHFEGYTNEIKF